jgi:hypothetical protein
VAGIKPAFFHYQGAINKAVKEYGTAIAIVEDLIMQRHNQQSMLSLANPPIGLKMVVIPTIAALYPLPQRAHGA